MSVFVILSGSEAGDEIHRIFKAAALESKGTEKYKDYMEEFGVVKRATPGDGFHTPLFQDVDMNSVFKLSLSFSESQKQALKEAGATVQDEAPQGYKKTKTFMQHL